MRSTSISVRAILVAALFGALATPSCGARSDLNATGGSTDGGGTSSGGAAGSAAGRGGTVASSGSGGTNGASGAGSGGCPFDLDSNRRHCGRCNLDCEEGFCSSGRCEPAMIAELGNESATALALDPTHVYWARPFTRMPKAGGMPELLSAETPDSVWGIAVYAGHVYWGSPTYGPVSRVSKSGAREQALTPDDLGSNRIAVDASGVYFTSHGLWRMAHDGSGLLRLTPEGDTGIALDDDFVYFTSRIKGEVYRMSKNGVSLAVLATAPLAHEIAVHGDYVVFTAQGDGLVRRVPRTGGPSVVIASGSGGVAVDASGVYFTDANPGVVGYVPIEGYPTGEQLVLSLELPRVRAIATDETRVFWTTDAPASAVYKLVKSGILIESSGTR